MTPFDKEVWARTCWAEARGEGTEGIRGVAHAIYNRFNAGKWFSGKTVAETCLFPLQFSCWNDSDINRRQIARVADDDPVLIACRRVVDDVLAGDQDNTFGATHYFSTSMKQTPDWAQSAKFRVQIGAQRFYSGVQ